MTIQIQHFFTPKTILYDRRLKPNERFVLLSLLSFASKDKSIVWPSLQLLSEVTGIHPTKISAATRSLESLGWIKKHGKGGFQKSTRYEILTPNIPMLAKTANTEEITLAETANTEPKLLNNAMLAETVNITKTAKTTLAKTANPNEDNTEDNNKDLNTSSVPSPVFQFILKCGKLFPINQEDFDYWKNSYPKVDLEEEFLSMIAWTDSNPGKRKTQTGIKRFINSWLSRCSQKPTIQDGEIDFDSNGWLNRSAVQ